MCEHDEVEHHREPEESEAGRDEPEAPQQLRAALRLLPAPLDPFHHVALNRLRRMKLSRSISSINRRIVVSISAAVITSSTRFSYASAASSIRGLVPTIP